MSRVPRDIGPIRVRPRCRALIAVPASLLALAGCTASSATTTAGELTPGPDAGDTACTELMDRLPDTVLSMTRNPGDTATGTATWGDPAISLSCGATPTGPTTDECIDVNDVAWVFTETGDFYSFLTYGRDPAVLVRVPTSVERSSATGALVDLKKAVAPLEQTENRCYDVSDPVPSS